MDKLIEKLKEVYRNRNWEEDCKEMEKISAQFNEYICQPIEYNTDTSVRHSNKNDDIVRATSNKEDVDLQNKESVR